MAKETRIRARKKGDAVEVKAIITHPMETGRRRDKETDKLVPANYIQKVICEYKDKVVFEAHWGTGISKNPFVGFEFNGGEKGETVNLSWYDNMGNSDSTEATIQ